MANAEVIREWVDALRSGEYLQGFGRLHYTDKAKKERYCCLGVLCDLAVKQGVKLHVNYSDLSTYSYDGEVGSLPASVRLWADINNSCPEVHREDSVIESLVRLNDDGKSFNEIADLIEKEYLTGV